MICTNCDAGNLTPDNATYCSVCRKPLHTDCAFKCVMCGNILCNECAINQKYKCTECYNVQQFKMEFISSTMFEAYVKCPHLFKHEHILNTIPEDERKNKYSETGKILHDVFDKYSYIRPLNDDEHFNASKELAAKLSEMEPSLFDNDVDFNTHYVRCINTLRNWYYEEQNKPIPLLTEMQHFVKLHGDLPLVRCTFDRINGERDDVENWEVEDYKTGKVYTSDMLTHNMQLPIYAMAIRELYGALPKCIRLRFPQHTDKSGTVQTRVFERITDDVYVCDVKRGGTYSISLSQRLNQMIDIYAKIKRGEFALNTSNTHFCENFCPLGTTDKCTGMGTKWATLTKRGY